MKGRLFLNLLSLVAIVVLSHADWILGIVLAITFLVIQEMVNQSHWKLIDKEWQEILRHRKRLIDWQQDLAREARFRRFMEEESR